MHFSSKWRIENLSSKSSVLMECVTSVHFFYEKSQATQWGRERARLLPWMGNHQHSRGPVYLTKQLPVARHGSLSLMLSKWAAGWLLIQGWGQLMEGGDWKKTLTAHWKYSWVKTFNGLENKGEMCRYSFTGVELHWIGFGWIKDWIFFCKKEWEDVKKLR